MSPERKAYKLVAPPTNYMPAFFGGPPNTRVCMPPRESFRRDCAGIGGAWWDLEWSVILVPREFGKCGGLQSLCNVSTVNG